MSPPCREEWIVTWFERSSCSRRRPFLSLTLWVFNIGSSFSSLTSMSAAAAAISLTSTTTGTAIGGTSHVTTSSPLPCREISYSFSPPTPSPTTSSSPSYSTGFSWWTTISVIGCYWDGLSWRAISNSIGVTAGATEGLIGVDSYCCCNCMISPLISFGLVAESCFGDVFVVVGLLAGEICSTVVKCMWFECGYCCCFDGVIGVVWTGAITWVVVASSWQLPWMIVEVTSTDYFEGGEGVLTSTTFGLLDLRINLMFGD